ncbi:Putative uncharacterized transposon-derived protein F52C9.6 [Eumeta japonica]|uniref:Uncharacterized transposon-derived protein F52C9.6 n=1 Tax=Eumeta variegata TaxID=151549 RepID=A0A4C1UHV2_EUMVA|nr:Putative uncharacterized transposon-derived protein F52C9.6 [Eumeta japonica]
MCILLVLVYGSETWPLTRNIINKLLICQHATERTMVGTKKTEKVGNVSFRDKTKVEDEAERIRKRKWKWAGHMIREKNKWSSHAIIPERWKDKDREATK